MSSKYFKIIHTSDWHLGQHFFGKSRKNEHHQFLAWLISTAVENAVDAIIVAGDIFDTGAPPSYARELYNQFVVNLQKHNIQLVILGGNHDSTATLGESKSLLAHFNTHVVPGAFADLNQHVIVLNDALDEPQAIVCAIPYLRSRDIIHSHAGDSGLEKQRNLQQAIADHYQQTYHIAQQYQQDILQQHNKSVPIIVTGHLTTVGAKTSESVRDIYIGALEAFPASAFPTADYIALGHIHRTQKVADCEHIRYSGSPIPLSFDELGKAKSVLLACFENGTLVDVLNKQVPTFQAMYLLKGDLSTIELEIKSLAQKYQCEANAWLHIEVSTQDYLNDLQQHIQAMIADLPLEVLVLRRQRPLRLHGSGAKAKETLQELSPHEVFERRLALENWDVEEEQNRKTRIKRAFDEILDSVNRQIMATEEDETPESHDSEQEQDGEQVKKGKREERSST